MSDTRRQRLRRFLFVLGPVVLVVLGGVYYAGTGRYIETENAYVKLDILAVSANVAGRVIEVAGENNLAVPKGAVLFRIDPEPFRIALADADAELGIVRNRIKALVATYREARVGLLDARDRTAYFAREYARQKRLRNRGVSTAARYDKAQLDLTLARGRERSLREKINIALEELGGFPNRKPELHPLYLKALATREQAALDLRNTIVRAPFGGTLSNFRLQVGRYVKSGESLFSLIKTGRVWIEANLKETQLTGIQVGQPATIVVDTYPDITWQARVESIASATGSEFALLPPQNASGNWVKVVQRLTVRLELKRLPGRPRLRSGMSVLARIDTGRENWLMRVAGTLFGGARVKQAVAQEGSGPRPVR